MPEKRSLAKKQQNEAVDKHRLFRTFCIFLQVLLARLP